VESGESFVIVGGSGTGKSVTLKHIIGLLKPDRARVVIDGQDIGQVERSRSQPFPRRFGMAFQEGALFDSMSVFENIAFRCAGTRRWIRPPYARGRGCLDLVHLEHGCRGETAERVVRGHAAGASVSRARSR